MVWGCVSTRGVGNIVFLKSTVTADVYMKVLESQSPCFIHRWSVWHLYGNEDMIFQQDVAPAHSTRSCTWKRSRHGYRSRAFKCSIEPANSPDLNIIEEVWNIMKRRIKSSYPTSFVELKELIVNTWSSIQVQELESLVASMPKKNCFSHPSKRWHHKILNVVFILFFYRFN